MNSNINKKNTELSILVVEDEFSFALELEMLIQEIGYPDPVCVDNSEEAMKIILANPPDLILMDIKIRGHISGIEIAEKLAHLRLPILFITSYKDELTYQRAQKVDAVGYLVKPINKYTLITAIQSVINNLNKKQSTSHHGETFVDANTLFFKRRNVYHKIPIDSIEYIKAFIDYTIAYCGTEQYTLSVTMNEFLDLLPADDFIRVHRSYIVNITKVTAVSNSDNKLWVDKSALPMSRRLKKDILSRIRLIE